MCQVFTNRITYNGITDLERRHPTYTLHYSTVNHGPKLGYSAVQWILRQHLDRLCSMFFFKQQVLCFLFKSVTDMQVQILQHLESPASCNTRAELTTRNHLLITFEWNPTFTIIILIQPCLHLPRLDLLSVVLLGHHGKGNVYKQLLLWHPLVTSNSPWIHQAVAVHSLVFV